MLPRFRPYVCQVRTTTKRNNKWCKKLKKGTEGYESITLIDINVFLFIKQKYKNGKFAKLNEEKGDISITCILNKYKHYSMAFLLNEFAQIDLGYLCHQQTVIIMKIHHAYSLQFSFVHCTVTTLNTRCIITNKSPAFILVKVHTINNSTDAHFTDNHNESPHNTLRHYTGTSITPSHLT